MEWLGLTAWALVAAAVVILDRKAWRTAADPA
jgi:hypothetical protein